MQDAILIEKKYCTLNRSSFSREYLKSIAFVSVMKYFNFFRSAFISNNWHTRDGAYCFYFLIQEIRTGLPNASKHKWAWKSKAFKNEIGRRANTCCWTIILFQKSYNCLIRSRCPLNFDKWLLIIRWNMLQQDCILIISLQQQIIKLRMSNNVVVSYSCM